MPEPDPVPAGNGLDDTVQGSAGVSDLPTMILPAAAIAQSVASETTEPDAAPPRPRPQPITRPDRRIALVGVPEWAGLADEVSAERAPSTRVEWLPRLPAESRETIWEPLAGYGALVLAHDAPMPGFPPLSAGREPVCHAWIVATPAGTTFILAPESGEARERLFLPAMPWTVRLAIGGARKRRGSKGVWLLPFEADAFRALAHQARRLGAAGLASAGLVPFGPAGSRGAESWRMALAQELVAAGVLSPTDTTELRALSLDAAISQWGFEGAALPPLVLASNATAPALAAALSLRRDLKHRVARARLGGLWTTIWAPPAATTAEMGGLLDLVETIVPPLPTAGRPLPRA